MYDSTITVRKQLVYQAVGSFIIGGVVLLVGRAFRAPGY